MSNNVSAASITAISTLLNITLVTSDNNNHNTTKEEEKQPELLFLEAIKKHSTSTSCEQSSAINNNTQVPLQRNDGVQTDDGSTNNDDSEAQQLIFSNQVKMRLPAPLNILIMLSTSSTTHISSPNLQIAGIQLTRSILLSPTWWKCSKDQYSADNKNDLERMAMECCTRLINNAKPKVQSEALKTIQLYQSYLGVPQWREKLSRSICPRLLDLINELPILARRGQETECINQLSLINGYLTLNNSKEASSANCSLAVSLSGPGGLEIVQQAFGGEI